MVYGFNYTHFAPPVSATDVNQMGVVKTYNTNRTLAQQQLGQAASAGLKAIRIPLFILAQEELGGLEDGFTLKLQTNSWLVDQEQQNLELLLQDVKAAGFSYVELGPGGGGKTLGAYNFTTLGTQWERMGGFIANMRPIMQSMGFADWSFDLCGEWIDPNAPVVLQFAQTMWTWYTSAFWPGGVRCTDATISFTPEPQNIAAIPSVFRGLDRGGPVNWPKQLQVHIYGAARGSVWASSHEALTYTIKQLPAIGAPTDTVFTVGETWDFRDLDNVGELSFCISENPGVISHIIQWPILRPGSNSSPALSPFPTSF